MRLHLLLFAVVVLAGSLAFADDFDESKAIERIESLGGKVWRDDTIPFRSVTGVDLHGNKKFNETDLHLLRSFK
jgi:hypothetical protein